MGNIYTVIPLSQADKESIHWFEETFDHNIKSLKAKNSHTPNIDELKSLLNDLTDYKMTIEESKEFVTIDLESVKERDLWTQLVYNLRKEGFYFSKGNELLIFDVMKIISRKYGPFMVMDDGFSFGRII